MPCLSRSSNWRASAISGVTSWPCSGAIPVDSRTADSLRLDTVSVSRSRLT